MSCYRQQTAHVFRVTASTFKKDNESRLDIRRAALQICHSRVFCLRWCRKHWKPMTLIQIYFLTGRGEQWRDRSEARRGRVCAGCALPSVGCP